MDHEDESAAGTAGHQNLNDLHNYLTTFNKEIEPVEDVLSTIGVDTEVGDVGDLYTTSGGHSLQDSAEVTGSGQFSSGFYSEQGILDNPLSDEAGQSIHALDSVPDQDVEEELASAIKQEVGTMDLGTGTEPLEGFREHVELSDALQSQGLIMTSLADGLDPTGGKVIRIVSLGEEGQYLTLGDGSQMQILSQGLNLDTPAVADSSYIIQGTEANIAKSAPTRARSLLSMPANSHLGLSGKSSTATTSLLTSASGNSSVINTSGTTQMSGVSQLVALQSAEGDLQPQLVALSTGTPLALSAEGLQQYGVLRTDGSSTPIELGYQAIGVLPMEINQEAMNYVLVMAPQESEDKPPVAQLVNLKQESQEYREQLVEVNGEVKRVLHMVPKKTFSTAATSGGTAPGAQLMCDFCDYTSPKRYLLTRHMKSHSDERPHKCPECNRGFKTPASLINHVNTHTGTRPHKCKTCDAAFTTSGELVRHIRYRHTFEKPHRCPSCDYASVELSKLKRHMRSHTGERPYKCPHCSYASPDTYKLKRHLRIHTGEKPYECDICHARFTQSNSLKAHKLIHSGNKPVFQCTLCPTTCGRKTDLKIHFNKLHAIGSPLECKKCGQILADRYSFKQHMRTHDMDRCFKCDQCDFIANTERSLDQHAAIHSNGKKFECDVCHMTFNLQQSLEKHNLQCYMDPEKSNGVVSNKTNDELLLARLGDNGESTLPSGSLEGSGTPSSVAGKTMSGLGQDIFPTPVIASDTLHKNLMQDIKAGKLGDVPQVVIVHPDGSLEEIPATSGDKLNLDDIFSTLSSTGKQEKGSPSDEAGITQANSGESPSGEKQDKTQESHNVAKEDDAGDTVQCEASTQVEIESDSESSEEVKVLRALSSKQARSHQEKTLEESTEEEQGDNKKSAVSPHAAAKEAVEKSSSLLEQLHSNAQVPQNDGTSSVTVKSSSSSSALSSTSQCDPPTQTSLTPSPTEASTALVSVSSSSPVSTAQPATSSNTAQPATSSNTPQYVVVKGYTCLSEDGNTVQPRLVNVAVDKDSLMKMFASLGPAGDGMGLQLLSGDLETGEEPAGRITQASIIPLHDMATLTAIGDAEEANSNLLGITHEESLTDRDSGLSELCGLAEENFEGADNKDSGFNSTISLQDGEHRHIDSSDSSEKDATEPLDASKEEQTSQVSQASEGKPSPSVLAKSPAHSSCNPLSNTGLPLSSQPIPKVTQSQLLTSKASCIPGEKATSDLDREPEIKLSLSDENLREPPQLVDVDRPSVFGMCEDDRSVSLQTSFCEAPPGNLFSDSLVEDAGCPHGDLALSDSEIDVGVETQAVLETDKSRAAERHKDTQEQVKREHSSKLETKPKGSTKRKASSISEVDAPLVRTSKRVRKALVKISM